MGSLEDAAARGLEQSDERSRFARAARLAWLATFQRNNAVMGRIEPLALLEEARSCYVNGHYIAVVLTATAFIEQTLVEQLEQVGDVDPRRALKATIKAARVAKLFPDDVLDCADDLREKRNPFSHRREEGDRYALSTRFVAERRHPDSVLEDDAQAAIKTMYAVFNHALTPGEEE